MPPLLLPWGQNKSFLVMSSNFFLPEVLIYLDRRGHQIIQIIEKDRLSLDLGRDIHIRTVRNVQ